MVKLSPRPQFNLLQISTECCNYSTFFFIPVPLRPHAGHGLLIHEVSRSHTTTHHSRWDSSGWVISSSQRPLPDNTQQSQDSDIHAPGGIRNHHLSRRVAADHALGRAATWTCTISGLHVFTQHILLGNNHAPHRCANCKNWRPFIHDVTVLDCPLHFGLHLSPNSASGNVKVTSQQKWNQK